MYGHHSLVTPIDWKPKDPGLEHAAGLGHHSLVTPIDWKLAPARNKEMLRAEVTTRW